MSDDQDRRNQHPHPARANRREGPGPAHLEPHRPRQHLYQILAPRLVDPPPGGRAGADIGVVEGKAELVLIEDRVTMRKQGRNRDSLLIDKLDI